MSTTQTNPQNDRRTLTHRGDEIGEENVDLLQNTTGTMSPVLKWTCPRKFKRIDYAAGVHPTRFVPRTKETADGDGSTTTFTLSTNFHPIAGEAEVADQPWESVIASVGGSKVEVADLNYGANEVTLASAPAAGTDNVHFWPVMGDGSVQYRGIDQFNHEVGALDSWGTPLQDFSDHDQMQQDSMIHLVGSLTYRENEVWALYINSPQQIVWEDADYPEGQYVSTIEQKVDVSV